MISCRMQKVLQACRPSLNPSCECRGPARTNSTPKYRAPAILPVKRRQTRLIEFGQKSVCSGEDMSRGFTHYFALTIGLCLASAQPDVLPPQHYNFSDGAMGRRRLCRCLRVSPKSQEPALHPHRCGRRLLRPRTGEAVPTAGAGPYRSAMHAHPRRSTFCMCSLGLIH